MERFASLLIYIFTILTTFGITLLLPVVLPALILECLRKGRCERYLAVLAWVGIGFVAGGFAGWMLRPFNWQMSFAETLRANLADHSIEYYAERVLLFVLMTGSAGAWVAGIVAALVTRGRRSAAPQTA